MDVQALRKLLIPVVFYPTLLYNMVLCRLLERRRWHDRIDEQVILGALPFASHVGRLHDEGVRGVVNTCAEYEGPKAAYDAVGIEQLYIPTIDFTPPTRADIDLALVFIRKFAARGESVYVHCKAGRGRSATVVMCWLMVEKGLTPEQAQSFLIEKRPHVNRELDQRAVVRELHAELKSPSVG